MTTAQGDPEVPTEAIERWKQAEEHLGTAIGRMVEEDYDGPSLLPGWDRRHVLAHLARNADAMVNLLTWARTGAETPAYASIEARDAEIVETAKQQPADLEADVLGGIARLAAAVEAMPPEAWSAQVRTRQGKEIAAVEVIWKRCREAYVHSVDLNTGVLFSDVPDDVLAGIVDDVFRTWAGGGNAPDLVVFAGHREWGSGSVAVSGSLADAAAWLTGRSTGDGLRADGDLPALPAWI
jgi:maleylpyruvate isomerase